MLDLNRLIELLNRPGTHSGTQLGESLGVSRVAVQKKIQGLIENGLPIQAVSGKGYCLERGVSLINAKDIQAALHHSDKVQDVEVLQSVESTNSYLMATPIGVGVARVCVAEAQTSGRGRRGNDWQSAPYRNVMMSVSWGFDSWPATITGLGLAVALCVTESLNKQFGLNIQIKWPNDLMVGGDKLAGVLIDVAGESSGACNVVIGLGLNVHQPDWSLGAKSAYQWQDLQRLGVSVSRNQLIALLVDALTEMLSEFSEQGFTHMVDRWNALSSYAGKQIKVGNDDSFIVGSMLGVDASGALLLKDLVGETHVFSESTVSVRLV